VDSVLQRKRGCPILMVILIWNLSGGLRSIMKSLGKGGRKGSVLVRYLIMLSVDKIICCW